MPAQKTAKTKRLKAPATPAPQSDAETSDIIKRLGDLQRSLGGIQDEMNAHLAAGKEQFEALAAPLIDRLKADHVAVQAYCETHRARLTKNGKTKTYRFAAGKIEWRTRPPSVTLRGIEDIIKRIKASNKLRKFLRVKEEVDKDALLADTGAAAGIKGVKINTGIEDFAVTPFGAAIDGGKE